MWTSKSSIVVGVVRNFFSAVMLIIATAAFAPAQAQLSQLPQPLPTPNLNLLGSGHVYAIARQPDGGTIIAGDFTSIDGVPRQNIARRKPDGSLDADWNPSINDRVTALAVDADGAIYVTGWFYRVGGQSRSSIAKLTPTGALDTSWNSGFVGLGMSVAIDIDGNVFAGGYFEVPVGGERHSLVKLSGIDGAMIPQWNPGFVGSGPGGLLVDGDWLYVGGYMQGMGGLQRRNIARVSRLGAGAVDAAWAPQPNGVVSSIAPAPGGAVFIAGSFNYVELQPRSGVAKVSASGSGAVDVAWNPNLGTDGFPRTVAVDASGTVYVGAAWEYEIGAPRPPHASLVKLSPNGTGVADPDWIPALNGSVLVINVAPGGSIEAGGSFVTDAPVPALGLATINPAGVPTASLGIEAPTGAVKAIALQQDGGMVVGGRFVKVNGQSRRNLLRLHADGSLDVDWNPASNGDVVALTATTNGMIYVGGRFTRVNNEARTGIAKLSGGGSGTLDPNWAPPITAGQIGAIAIGEDNTLYVGGDFQSNAPSIRYLAKLSTVSGSVDSSWNPAPNALVNGLMLDGKGHLFASGRFSNIGGVSRNALAKLFVGGSGMADASWNASFAAFSEVDVIAMNGGDHVYAGGSVIYVPGMQSGRLGRFPVSGSGAFDANWNPPSTNQGEILALAISSDGTLYTSERRLASFSPPALYFYQSTKLRTDDGGSQDSAWTPSIYGHIGAMAAGNDAIYIGGNFTRIGNQSRFALAALPRSVPDAIFGHGFD